MIPGLDVSHHQGVVDWRRVAAAGYRFAFVKATEGVSGADPAHDRNVYEARRAGLLVGSYHYAHPGQSPFVQAQHHVSVVGKLLPGRLPCVLDLEQTDGLSDRDLRIWASVFLDHVRQSTGRGPLLYTGAAFLHDNLNGGQFDGGPGAGAGLWIARYGPDPGIGAFWQHTSSGTVPGISGRVDLNWYRGSSADLTRLAEHPEAPAPAPPPPAVPTEETEMRFVHADGNAVYLTNGATDTRHIETSEELHDLANAGLATLPAKRIRQATLDTLLRNAR